MSSRTSHLTKTVSTWNELAEFRLVLSDHQRGNRAASRRISQRSESKEHCRFRRCGASTARRQLASARHSPRRGSSSTRTRRRRFFILCTNTMHKEAEAIERAVSARALFDRSHGGSTLEKQFYSMTAKDGPCSNFRKSLAWLAFRINPGEVPSR
jgi:hypothetical protein